MIMFSKLFKHRMQGKKDKATKIEEEVIQNEESAAPVTDEVSETDQLNEDIQKLKSEAEELKDKYLRLYSDFENYKRRTNKERLELFKTAGEEVLKSLLPVLDDFDRAEKAFEASTDATALADGIKLVSHKFKNTLSQHGMVSYASVGEVFNADLHEAIVKTPAPSDDMKGKVVDEIEKGYKLQDKVIRFAKVVVGE